MNTRKVVYLFFTTMFIGAAGGAVVGVPLTWDVFQEEGFWNFFWGVVWMLGIGAAVSIVAQMGYFAYLVLHRFALSLFKTRKLWNLIQILLIAFVYFDLVYLRYIAYAEPGEHWTGYLITPTLLLIYAVIIAYWKMKETNWTAFVPAVFFMFVITTIEWVPALTVQVVNDSVWLWIYLAPLIAANTYQLIALHRLQRQDK
ncbi:KinB-signaling pathway activation protein [Geomicrobium sp. JSM 1781026]|uniref:KinB-signaling pathway activation protein n=1 Tax=Geomicrobium sp. JSM 1781026 TaxID=3344580 RepID=UPI0035BECAFE